MRYLVREDTPARLTFETAPEARRGRGILFAVAPICGYLFLLFAGLFIGMNVPRVLSFLWELTLYGGVLALLLAVLLYVVGTRARLTVSGSRSGVSVVDSPARGAPRTRELPRSEIARMAVDLDVRSLGVDLKLVAITPSGARLVLAEGDVQSRQLIGLGEKLSVAVGVPFERPVIPAS